MIESGQRPQSHRNHKTAKNRRKQFNKKHKQQVKQQAKQRKQTKVYLCTLCKEPAQKVPCGTVKDTLDGEVRTGLGKWRCRTHGKCKVQVVTNIEQEKAA